MRVRCSFFVFPFLQYDLVPVYASGMPILTECAYDMILCYGIQHRNIFNWLFLSCGNVNEQTPLAFKSAPHGVNFVRLMIF